MLDGAEEASPKRRRGRGRDRDRGGSPETVPEEEEDRTVYIRGDLHSVLLLSLHDTCSAKFSFMNCAH